MKKEQNNFIEDFLKIQKQLKPITKEKKGYNYKYAPLEVIWEEVRDIIIDNNFIVFNEINEIGVKTIALHKSGHKLVSLIPFSETYEDRKMSKAQARGAEITYFRRYNLISIFNIQVEDEDSDACINRNVKNDIKMTQNEPFESKQVTPPIYIRNMFDEAKKKGIKSKEDLLEYLIHGQGLNIDTLPTDREGCEKIINLLKK